MDLEVLARIAIGSSQLHGISNSFLGATVVALVTVPAGKPICEIALRWWNRNLSPGLAKWLEVAPDIRWTGAWIAGALGVYSHVVLDAMMHSDAFPFAPVSKQNPFLDMLSVDEVNVLCVERVHGNRGCVIHAM